VEGGKLSQSRLQQAAVVTTQEDENLLHRENRRVQRAAGWRKSGFTGEGTKSSRNQQRLKNCED